MHKADFSPLGTRQMRGPARLRVIRRQFRPCTSSSPVALKRGFCRVERVLATGLECCCIGGLHFAAQRPSNKAPAPAPVRILAATRTYCATLTKRTTALSYLCIDMIAGVSMLASCWLWALSFCGVQRAPSCSIFRLLAHETLGFSRFSWALVSPFSFFSGGWAI